MKRNTIVTNSLMSILLCAAIILEPSKVCAASGAWNPIEAGNWNDTTSWVDGVIPSGPGAVASFTSGVQAHANQNVIGLTLGGLFFSTGFHTVTNNAITLDNNGSPAVLTVGIHDVYTDHAVLASPLNGTGGLIKQGPGRLDLAAKTPGTLAGAVTVKSGTLSSSATNGAPLGTGRVAVNGTWLNFAPAGSGQNINLTAASGDATNTVIYRGGAMLGLEKGANSSVTLTLGNAGAASDSVLARANNGVLIVAPANGTSPANLGVAERLLVNGDVATHNGMVNASIVGRNNDSGASADFLTYGVNGFEAASYTAGLGGGASSIANVSATTATDSAQVYALRVNSGALLTINSGKTLTVGDGTRPAGLILNNAGTQPTEIKNGVLDFGTSEGIIHFSGKPASGGIQTTISSTLSGQNGITLVGTSPNSEIKLNPVNNNTYTGGTRIQSGRVSIAKAESLGGGDVTIVGQDGWGGQLYLTAGAAIITNALHISGLNGPQEATPFGVIRINNGIGNRFTGPIELLGDSCITADQTTTIATFSGPISGPWGLEFGGNYPDNLTGTIVLGGANTYTGGTIVRSGTVKIDTGGTLGTGPVENRTKLVFASANTLDLTNTLTGSGALTHQGSGTLMLRNVPNYAGPLNLNGTLDLSGASAAFGSLSGVGRVINPSGPAAVLTVGSANASTVFSGRVEDQLSLVKTGTGTLTLFNTNSYSGSTTVSGGTLRMANGLADLSTSLAYRLDASALASLTRSGTNVLAWADADGRAVTFSQGTTDQQPVYVVDAINGRPAVRFGVTSSKRLVANASVSAQTVFVVYRMNAFADANNGIWGQNLMDAGIRATGISAWQRGANASDFTYQGEMYIDSVPGNTFTAYQPHILTAVSSNVVSWTAAIGHYTPANLPQRYFRGDISEILVFSRMLSPNERKSVESYLSNKWLNDSMISVSPNMLPTTTALSLSAGTVVDFNGVDQTIASLTGTGTARNSNASASTLTVGGDNASTAFTGVIEGALKLVKTGTGTLTLNGISTATGATVIQSGTLKLGEWLPTQGLSYRLDATEAATVTLSGSNVTSWADENGSALKVSQATTGLQPTYVTNAINGLPAVRFGTASSKRLVANASVTARTVFIAYRINAHADYNNGIWGKDSVDFGIRATSVSAWQRGANASDFTYLGDMYIDGVPGSTFTAYQPHILTAVSSEAVNWTTTLGHYYTGLAQRYFRGDIGEVLVYDRVLPVEERESVENYLNQKWIAARVMSRLATNASVTVASGATLDLNGQKQKLFALKGSGTVTNGNVTVTGQVAPGGDGTIGTLTLTDAPNLSGELRIDASADGTCDRLAVSGDLDVSQLALVIVDAEKLKSKFEYTIATGTGNLTGSFTSDNLPLNRWSVRYVRTSGAFKILLVPKSASVISIR